MPFRYRLIDRDGREIGEYPAAVPDFSEGDLLWINGRATHRVVEVLDAQDDRYQATFVIEAVAL